MNETELHQAELGSELPQPDGNEALSAASERRLHQRFACAVKVSAEIPFVPTLALAARDFSQGGMRLDFQDETVGFRALNDNLIEAGCAVVLRFKISLQGKRHECSVKADIVRFTEHGLGVHFGDTTPWQLVKLVEMFARAHPETDRAE